MSLSIRRRPGLPSIFTAIGIAAVAIMVFWIWREPRDELPLTEKFKITIQVGAGVAALFGLIVAWRRSNAHLMQAKAAEEGLITERFTRAIQQLGDAGLAVRLGGIYALEKIAQDDPERYHWTVMEVLCAYVRENEPRTLEIKINEESKPMTSRPKMPESLDKVPTIMIDADKQAILTVLGRRKTKSDPENQTLNLAGAHLEGVNLLGADLQRAYLFEAHLQRAYLCRAHLEGANLGIAHLEKAILADAHLEGANLWGAYLNAADCKRAHLESALLAEADLRHVKLNEGNLANADLTNADLTEADLRKADLRNAKLSEAELADAYLTEANLGDAILFGVNLCRADLSKAKLWGAILTESDLSHAFLSEAYLNNADLSRSYFIDANLSYADLVNADLSGADLRGTNLKLANLGGADLSAAQNLTQEQIDEARGNEETEIPRSLKRPAGWPTPADEGGGKGPQERSNDS